MPSCASLPSLTKRLNQLATNSDLSGDRLSNELAKHHPNLARQLEADRAHQKIFAKWGQSSNIDAGAKKEIVQPALLSALSDIVRQPFDAKTNVANAGLLHTYGYLLSNLKTPFGYKRARWCQGEIEAGLKLPKGWLSAAPKKGTLLQNLTSLFEAFYPNAATTRAVPNWDSRDFSGITLTEKISDLPISLLTRVIEFDPASCRGKNCAVLFYAAEVEDQLRFVTAFPVGSWMIGKLKKTAKKSEGQIKPKYNAVLPQFSDGPLPGEFELATWPPNG